MSESEFQEEALAALLRERGYTVEKPDEAADIDALRARIDALEHRTGDSEEQQESPQDGGERDVAHQMLDHLNASRTPWLSTGGGPDAA
jgi:hypothetical protein